ADMAAARPGPPPDAEDEGLPRFSLNNLVLEEGSISLDDRVTGRKQQVDEIALGVPFISTFGYATDIDVQPRVHLRINGSPFDLTGVARPFDVVPASTLNVAFQGLELEKWADAWPAPLPVKVERALLDSDLQVVFEQPRDAAPRIKVVGDLGLRQLDVRETSGEPLLAWSTLDVRRIAFDLVERRLAVGQVELWSPQAHTRRDASQRVNWLEIINKLQALGGGQPASKPAPAPKPLRPGRGPPGGGTGRARVAAGAHAARRQPAGELAGDHQQAAGPGRRPAGLQARAGAQAHAGGRAGARRRTRSRRAGGAHRCGQAGCPGRAPAGRRRPARARPRPGRLAHFRRRHQHQ